MRAAWTTSALIHAGVVAGAALAYVLSQKKAPPLVEVRVIEAPQPAPPNLDLSKARPPEPKPKEPEARKVFGVSRKAIVADSGPGPEIKAGNTVAKAPDDEKLKPSDADSLPIPTDEYLVSEMPAPLGELRIPYPTDAKAKGLAGAVVMSLLIDDAGRVREAKLVRGAGGGLDEAALAAVRGLRFRPAKVGEKPVAVRIQYTHRFVLEAA